MNRSLLAKIIFSRILEMPLSRYSRLARAALAECDRSGTLACGTARPGQALLVGVKTLQGAPLNLLGKFEPDGSFSTSWPEIFTLAPNGEIPVSFTLVCSPGYRRLIDVFARNRMHLGIIEFIGDAQRKFIETGDATFRRPLSMNRLVERLSSNCRKYDASQINRLVRRLELLIGNERWKVTQLFPSTMELGRTAIMRIFHTRVCADDQTETPGNVPVHCRWNDARIAEELKNRYGIILSRRAVAACRRASGLPSFFHRRSKKTGFLRLFPRACHLPPALDYIQAPKGKVSLLSGLPIGPAVYMIGVPLPPVVAGRTTRTGSAVRDGSAGMKRDIQVVYIGRSVNMRKRIAEHLRGKNSLLYHHLTNYSCWVRFIPLARDETVANEKRLFDEYLRIFGSRPTCNRIRP